MGGGDGGVVTRSCDGGVGGGYGNGAKCGGVCEVMVAAVAAAVLARGRRVASVGRGANSVNFVNLVTLKRPAPFSITQPETRSGYSAAQ